MTKTLQKYGNSHALVIDKALMDAMGITPETPLTLTVNGTSLTVSPAQVGLGQDEVNASLQRLRKDYDKMLKNLAK
jgi:antitoxin component of MazEF toxin-antitoxin module